MGIVRFVVVGLLLLWVSGTCQAASFEKISSSLSVSRNVHLDCSAADPGTRDWPFSETVDAFDQNSVTWGHTPVLKENLAKLVSLNALETAKTGRIDDSAIGGGGGEGEREALDAGDPVYNRVIAEVMQRPVIEFWQPGYGESYSIGLAVQTHVLAYYRIMPIPGENIGDEVTLTVVSWTEHSENSTGPPAGAIGSDKITNSAAAPGYVNQADGIWRQIDGTVEIKAHIGDTIGISASATSSINAEGAIVGGWMANSYMPCGLFARSSIDVSLPMFVPPGLPGDLNADESISLDDAILGLQAASGLTAPGLRSDYVAAKIDVNGDGQAGLAEVICILQNLAEMRQITAPGGSPPY